MIQTAIQTTTQTFVLLLCLAGSVSAQSFPTIWMLGQPDAQVLMGVDVRSLSTSAAGKLFHTQADQQLQQMGPLMFHVPGMELFGDIDRVFLSTPGSPQSAAAVATKKPSPFLAVLQGTFPPEHLLPWLKGPHSAYRTVPLYRPSSPNGAWLAALDERTLLLGDEKSIRGALDRRGTQTGPPKAMLLRAAALASASDFWIVAAAGASSSLPGAAGPWSAVAAQVAGVDFGLSLREGLTLDANVTTTTEAAAGIIAQLVSSQMQTAEAAQFAKPEAIELMQKLKITTEGPQVRMHVALTQEEMDRQIRIMQEARQAVRQTGGGIVTAPSQPTGPRTVRIYGLDDGVREIPIGPAAK